MARQFPFLAAASVTALAGLVVSNVVPAAVTVPVGHVSAPSAGVRVGGSGGPAVQTPPSQLPGNAANTPGSTGPAFSPGNPNLNVGSNAFTTVVQSEQYGQAAMNQPGQAAYGETFISNQTWMNQPGQGDFYEGTINPNILQANQGSVPAMAYPNPNSPATGLSATAARALGYTLTQSPNTVGFFSGFGPGQPDFGFYAGFTTPR
jgi:hypothetical protein